MSDATRDKTKEKQAEQPDQDALDLLESLSFRRRSKHMLDDMELAKLYDLLQHFMESPALRTAPIKKPIDGCSERAAARERGNDIDQIQQTTARRRPTQVGPRGTTPRRRKSPAEALRRNQDNPGEQEAHQPCRSDFHRGG